MKALAAVLCLALASCFTPSSGGTSATDAGAPQTGTTTQSAGVQGAAASTPAAANATTTFDTAKKLEVVDVWVETGDPQGQRALVPYLLKPEEWMLIKCEMLSATSKHYRFQRVSSTDGKSLPQVDIFKQGR